MNGPDKDRYQLAWTSQRIVTEPITADDMRANAARFERKTKRRNMADLVSFAFVLIGMAIGVVLLQGILARTGAILLMLWATIGLYSVRRFNSLTPFSSSDSSPMPFAAWYQLQLERQRDVALSRPLGIALAAPGIALLLLGYVVENGTPWTFSVILGGLFLFLGVGAVIHGQLNAGRWQQEINSLQSMRKS